MRKKRDKKTKITVRLTEEMIRVIDHLAKRNNKSRSEIIREAIEEQLRKEKQINF